MFIPVEPGPGVIKPFFTCSTQLSMKSILLISSILTLISRKKQIHMHENSFDSDDNQYL